MNKYLKLYFLDSILMIGISILTYYLIQKVAFDIQESYFASRVLAILAIISFIMNIICLILKKEFNEKSTLFVKFFLLFMFIVLILGIIMNNFMYVKCLHIGYYYGFLIFNYLLLSVYTNLSFIKEKKVRKKNK